MRQVEHARATERLIMVKRGAYSYPAVALDGHIDSWREISFQSTWQMDHHHRDLLTSPDSARSVMGYLSTIFWGHLSGQDGRVGAARAKAKARQALNQIANGAGGGIQGAANTIHQALAVVELERCGDAVKLLYSDLPQLGPAVRVQGMCLPGPKKMRCDRLDNRVKVSAVWVLG